MWEMSAKLQPQAKGLSLSWHLQQTSVSVKESQQGKLSVKATNEVLDPIPGWKPSCWSESVDWKQI